MMPESIPGQGAPFGWKWIAFQIAVLASAPVLVFSQAATFPQWQAVTAGAGAAPHDNRDGDLWDDIAEFALGSSPSSGVPSAAGNAAQRAGLILAANGNGGVDAMVWRPTGLSGINYELEMSADLASWSPLGTPAITGPINGGEILVWSAIDAGTQSGFARLKLTLDASETSISLPAGWSKVGLVTPMQSFGLTLLPEPLYVGTVKQVNGTITAVQDIEGSDLRSLFVAGRSVFLEFTEGPGEGHRIEVDVGQCTAKTITLNLSSPDNTTAVFPSGMAGARFVLRHYEVLGDVFPKDAFTGSDVEATADAIKRWTGSIFDSYWLLDTRSQNGPSAPYQWVLSGDVTQADQSGTLLRADEGVFVGRQSPAPIVLVDMGEVRGWRQRRAVSAGMHMLSGSYPLDQSPVALGMSEASGFVATTSQATADTAQVWKGDAIAGQSGYDLYWYFTGLPDPPGAYWVSSGDATFANQNDTMMFARSRALFVEAQNPLDYLMPYPPQAAGLSMPINPFRDSDEDGLGDAWEIEHFGNLAQSGGDADADGITNHEEYLVGTDPLVAASSSQAVGLVVTTPLE